MPLTLPRVHILLDGPSPRALASRPDLLSPRELKRLVAYDVRLKGMAGPIDRVVPLGESRWGVCRRSGTTTVWRIVDSEHLGGVHQPAWLWTEPSWFDASNAHQLDGREPSVESLRFLMRHAASLGGSRKQTIRTLSAAIAGLRRQKRPVAVVVPPAVLRSAANPARWFTLALLASLPRGLRLSLRISIGDPQPDPRRLDLVVTDREPPGFRLVAATESPDEGRDLVAYYVRNRLNANDPEAVETAAELYDGPVAQDGWGEGIRKLIRSGVPGVSAVSEELIERDPDGAMRAVRARLRAGAPLDDDVIASLVALTVMNGEHRVWRPLVIRPAVERARAVSAVLDHVDEIHPRKELLEVLGAIQPRGAAFDKWCQVLLSWMRATECTASALDILREVILDWPATEPAEGRADLWCSAVRGLIAARDYEGALSRLHDDVALELASAGHAAKLASLWSELPPERRSLDHLEAVIDLVDGADDRDAAITALVRAARGDAVEMRAIVNRWNSLGATPPSSEPGLPSDRTRSPSRSREDSSSLLQDDLRGGDPRAMERVISSLTDPRDPLWLEVEAAQAQHHPDVRARFVALRNLRRGLTALEPTALALVGAAIEATTLPDQGITDVALAMIDLPERSDIWPWVAITSAPTDQFDAPTLDATLVEFLRDPPDTDLELDVAHGAMQGLALAGGWTPLQHARWLARLVLAPDAGRGLNEELAHTLLRSIARRPDAIERIASITTAFLELPPDHAVVAAYTSRLLPSTWEDGPPPELVQAIEPWRLRSMAPVWSRALGR
ncbi:MAG: hypothetical protein ACI8PZ_002953 [Myxococcota bacterium]|jgi:hypothetical protein